MYESLKAMKRRLRDPGFASRYFVGYGIDIGSGPDPLGNQRFYGAWPMLDACREWDMPDGDAQFLEGIPDETFDFVYSSHTLEHMVDPLIALHNWWRVLKRGGYLIVVVPDEDMYEQGVWPSTFNGDHKHTFAVGKDGRSWSPVSKDIDFMVRALRGEIIKIERIEENFVFDIERIDQTAQLLAESCIECIVRKPLSPAGIANG